MSARLRRYLLASAGTAVAVYVASRVRRARRTIDLAGRVVLITGGSRGLGLLLARAFASAGCRVSICARDALELQRAEADLAERGADVLALQCDVTERAAVERWVAETEAHFGRLDILVNNASIIQVGPLESLTLDDFERAMAVNFWGTVYATMAVLPRLRAQSRGEPAPTRQPPAQPGGTARAPRPGAQPGAATPEPQPGAWPRPAESIPAAAPGRIVNITSIGARVAVPHLLPYDCAKFAALGFSKGLSAELARHGIVVTTIIPGLMRTGSPVNALFKGRQELEFAWFSLGDALPFTSMDAERAAQRIVEATRRGEGEVTLTWQARLLGLAHALFPGSMTDVFGLINRVLPGPADHDTGLVRGMELTSPVSPSPLTSLMNRAARRNNQYGGQFSPTPEHADKVGLQS